MLDDAEAMKSPFVVFADKLKKWLLPATLTMLCGTVTYPIAVRIARKVFRLKGFYAIHLSIAPFLALVHVNIFGTLHSYFRLKIAERDFDLYFGKATNNIAMQQFIQGRDDNVPSFDYIHASYYKVKDEVVKH